MTTNNPRWQGEIRARAEAVTQHAAAMMGLIDRGVTPSPHEATAMQIEALGAIALGLADVAAAIDAAADLIAPGGLGGV